MKRGGQGHVAGQRLDTTSLTSGARAKGEEGEGNSNVFRPSLCSVRCSNYMCISYCI